MAEQERLLCPLLTAAVMTVQAGDPLRSIEVQGRCRESRCAWWLPNIGHCAVVQIAHELMSIQDRLAEQR